MRTFLITFALLPLVALAACKDEDGNEVDLAPICHALIKPIKYNTYKVTSGRYAGRIVALDIKQHNEVWAKLNCVEVLHP